MSYRKSYGVRVYFAGPGSKNQTFQFKTRRLAERIREGLRIYKQERGFCTMRLVMEVIYELQRNRGIPAEMLAGSMAGHNTKPVKVKTTA